MRTQLNVRVTDAHLQRLEAMRRELGLTQGELIMMLLDTEWGRREAAAPVTEIERAVITLLVNHGQGFSTPLVKNSGAGLWAIWHPALKMWIEALCSDPHEMRRLEQFAQDNAVALDEAMSRDGFSIDTGRDSWFERNIERAYLSKFAGDEGVAGSARDHDRVVERLAWRLVQYRQAGRTAGEMVSGPLVHGGEDELGMSMSTSLAAAIGEYQMDIAEALRLEGERGK